MSFAGKTAIVTGAAGGMGLAVARDLLEAGAQVTLIDVKEDPPELAELGDAQRRARYVRADLTDDAATGRAVRSAHEATGRLDYLVNAAGVLWFGRDRSLVDIDLDVWDQVLAIDLKSIVHTTRHAVPLMRATGGGAMVHVSSTQCLRGDDKPQDAYQASKAAVIALSKSLAIQLAADGIRSNVLVPGPTESPMQARWSASPELRAATARAIPLGRVGTTRDMADAILFLLSDRASFITGTELIVDGGLLARP
jgi:NAD(P)-dependent dehydrogenase (short-subunit alcohol dehydrogenase family)